MPNSAIIKWRDRCLFYTSSHLPGRLLRGLTAILSNDPATVTTGQAGRQMGGNGTFQAHPALGVYLSIAMFSNRHLDQHHLEVT